MIFPNLFIAEIQLFQIPAAGGGPDRAARHLHAVQGRGGPEPSGAAADIARSAGGPSARRRLGDVRAATSAVWRAPPEWVLIARGLKREHVDPEGFTVSNNTDETTLRAIWRHYMTLMDR